MSRLLALYPRAWRARYGEEFAELLESRPPSLPDRLDIVLGAIDARINPQVPGEESREVHVAGDPAARLATILTGVLLTIWGAVGAAVMVPWDSGLEPTGPAELMTLAWVSGLIGAVLAPVALGIIVVRYERALGGTGLAGAVLTGLGLVMGALGMGIAALVALAAGVTLFSWRARERIVSTAIAIAFAAGSLAAVASFLLFWASNGQETWLVWPIMGLGPSWILLGLGLRKPRAVTGSDSAPAPSLAGA